MLNSLFGSVSTNRRFFIFEIVIEHFRVIHNNVDLWGGQTETNFNALIFPTVNETFLAYLIALWNPFYCFIGIPDVHSASSSSSSSSNWSDMCTKLQNTLIAIYLFNQKPVESIFLSLS